MEKARGIYNFSHGFTSAVVIATASLIVVIASSVFSNLLVLLISSSTLGYFGQLTVDHIDENQRDNPTVQKVIKFGRKIKNNTSFETFFALGMLGALPSATVPATILTFGVGTVWIRNQLQEDEISELESEASSAVEFTALPDVTQTEQELPLETWQETAQKVILFIKDNKGILLLMVAGSGLIFAGLPSLNEADRVFGWQPLVTQYGIRILTGMLGYQVENRIHANLLQNPQEKKWKWLHNNTPLNGIIVGISTFCLGIARSPLEAYCAVLPLGFVTGLDLSAQWRKFLKAEKRAWQSDRVTEIGSGAQEVQSERRRCFETAKAVTKIAIFTIAPIVGGAYILGTTNYKTAESSYADIGTMLLISPIFFHATRLTERGENEPEGTLGDVKKYTRFFLQYCHLPISGELNSLLATLSSPHVRKTSQQGLGLDIAASFTESILYGSYRRMANEKTSTGPEQETPLRLDVIVRIACGAIHKTLQ
ncbi:hypothetical protein JYU14_03320 [Simkania negevensis]|uniref:Uncharacterized protein n=1 Tax=Simkania negevensis TaxID=83561 RepID=A0ABS3AUA4_9BACT|nr:hypothetical protein [Simkania negevensis]